MHSRILIFFACLAASWAAEPSRIVFVESGGGFSPGIPVKIYASGLGANPAIRIGGPSTPLVRALVKPIVTVNLQQVEVIDSVLAPGEIGIYRVTFKVPPGGGYEQIALSIGDKISEGLPMPIGGALLLTSIVAARESL